MADRHEDDLEARLDDLEETLDALREEIEATRGPRRPPRPREFARFTDEYVIPAAIAVMEANIRALEFLQAGIRAGEPERASGADDRPTRDRAAGVGRASLERLDRALGELESALAGSGLPASPEARELLGEARRLNDEVRERVAAGQRGPSDDAVRIDVESELDSIREEVSGEDGPEDGDERS